jgi:transcriptional regulator of arginine metabolism
MTSRERRLLLIKRLVQRERIQSQDEMVRMLEKRGISCTQATLSRDLRDLNIVRGNTARGPEYTLDRRTVYVDALRRVVGMEILNVRHNQSLVVIRTMQGRAEGVAAFLDSWKNENILGTVAGDDTVFVAPTDVATIADLADQIRSLQEHA